MVDVPQQRCTVASVRATNKLLFISSSGAYGGGEYISPAECLSIPIRREKVAGNTYHLVTVQARYIRYRYGLLSHFLVAGGGTKHKGFDTSVLLTPCQQDKPST
ncbi:hypothetical protein BDV35DRAFT_352460 [Aspergillus flavus]|uniref:Uncharacterized protein n=1 Tax=Aspergillus flavus TaxID=5059 RepID=A0A5N6GYN3_ASPFL|nr:hypothetical protein BDV35DRAFT_352460 [Aspergillus flavus]